MARQRMYLFERSYVDYAAGLRKFRNKLLSICGAIWNWFWKGTGATVIEGILRLLVVAAAIVACVLYVRYEFDHGRSFSAGMLIAIVAIWLFTFLVLWGWKAPVHFIARIVSGISASGPIFILTILAIVFAILVFTPYLLVLFLLTALSFVIFLPMRTAHTLWLLYRRITYRCPYDDCAYSGLPIHVCSCGQRYNDLKPSFYGIFHHVCRHLDKTEAKLPTMDFLGRNKLPRLCGACGRPLIFSSMGELAERPIAIVGGPSSGKTLFLRQATRRLRDYLGTMRGSTVRIDSKVQERELENDFKLLDRGMVLEKTSGDVMRAFGLAVRIRRRFRYLLYLFDAPGEHFLAMEQFGRKQAIQHIAAIILLVDPFSLPALSEHGRRLSTELKPSETPFQRIVDVLINGVNMMLVRQPTDRCNIPLAVVISKGDAFPEEDFPFLSNLYSDNEHAVDEAFHTRCKQALEKLGAERSIYALEQKFSNVRYFACTTLGRMPDRRNNSPFKAEGVISPFLWLLALYEKKTKAKAI